MNSQILNRIRKRREEDDDDMLFFIWPVLHRMLGPIDKKQRHSSILYGKKRINDILTGHVKNCLVAYRMEPHIFRALASYLRREKLILDTRIKVEEKLAFFLYMVSHNASYEALQLEFQHSGWTFHEYIKDFFDIIPVLASRFLKPPNIDEPHLKLPITATPEIAAPFRNRKGTLSHNVMVACDFDLRITFISCGWEGSATDARVLHSALRNGFRVPDATQAGVDAVAQRGVAGKKPQKEPKKPKKREDAMVGVMEKYVEIKRKQAEEESAFLVVSRNAQEFTISKCIAVLHKMQSIERGERAAAYKVFKVAENRETFLISAADDEESAAEWLQSEMAELPRGI